jgi:hypothetical protein
MNWEHLSELYRIAPLGEKPANDLAVVFANSRFKCFVYDNDKLVGAGRALADGLDCSYICDIAVHTAMAIFLNQEQALKSGLVSEV